MSEKWEAHNGRAIKSIYFDDPDDAEGLCIRATEQVALVMHVEYMGDRTECWVIERDRKTGIERARHNARFIETICWADPVEIARVA